MLELSSLKERIKEILVRDSITEAIKDLKQWLPQSNKKYNDLLLIEARKNNADRDRLHDVVSGRELEQTYNRIIRDVLGFIDSLQISDFNTPNDQTPNKVQPTYVFRLKEKANSILQSINFGNFTDPRDNRDYRTIEINGLTWMAENLKYSKVEDCSFYRNNSELGEKYGCLYTWDAAKKACPEGWRLPTIQEWENLREAFGNTQEASKALMIGGQSGFDVLLGGKRTESGQFYELEEIGYYWTGDESGSKKAFDLRFRSRGELINDHPDLKSYRFSCRCVKMPIEKEANNDISRDKKKQDKIKPALKSYSTFTDPRDNQTYKTVKLLGLIWMAENFNYAAKEGCWFLKNDPMTADRYGRLYTWDAAKEACPRGWRLPTDEEFKALAIAFGGYYDKNIGEKVNNPKEGYKQLQDKLLIYQFSGYREKDGKFYDYNEVASFWTKSRVEAGRYSKYCNYDFAINSATLYRTQSPRHLGLSCRYVRENEHDDGIKY